MVTTHRILHEDEWDYVLVTVLPLLRLHLFRFAYHHLFLYFGKLVPAIFYQIFISHQMTAFQKL